MIYYIADTHFGHESIIRLCGRPYSNIDEMDEAMIANWNKAVHRDDHVYILGDFIFRSAKEPGYYFSRLKGKKHIIVGNHDKKWLKRADPALYEDIAHFAQISDRGRRVILCHYPMMTWPDRSKGAYMVYGHIHGNKALDFWPLIQKDDHLLNAGVEINGYAPVSLEQLMENNAWHKAEN